MFYPDDLLEQWLCMATRHKSRLVRLAVGLPLSAIAGLTALVTALVWVWQGDDE